MSELSNMATITSSTIVNIANKKGEEFKNIKTHQIRNFFSEINSIKLAKDKKKSEAEIRSAIVLLQPKLAYATGRKPNELKEFYKFMTEAIQGVTSQTNQSEDKAFDKAVANFIILVESVVAYHKFHGGKDN